VSNSGVIMRFNLLVLGICLGVAALAQGLPASSGSTTSVGSKVAKAIGPPPSYGNWVPGPDGLTNPLKSNVTRAASTRASKPMVRDVTQAPTNDIQPVYGPEFAVLYFASNARERSVETGRLALPGVAYHIWRTNTDGFSGVQLTGLDRFTDEANGDQMYPWISNTGHLLAYSTRRVAGAGNFDVYIRNLTNGSRIQITSQSNPGNNIHPTLNPSGSNVVFSSNRFSTSNPGRRYRLYWGKTNIPNPSLTLVNIYSGFGGGSQNFDDVDAAWSPDGLTVVFTRRYDNGESHIWFVANVISPSVTGSGQLTGTTIDGVPTQEKEPAWVWNYVGGSASESGFVFSTNREFVDTDYVLTPNHWNIFWYNSRAAGYQPETTYGNNLYQLVVDPGGPDPDTSNPNGGAEHPTAAFFPLLTDGDWELTYQSTRPKEVNGVEVQGRHDIWTSLLNDNYLPTLDAIPQVLDVDGNPVQEQAPGSTFIFRIPVSDSFGMKSVFLQFKDPDLKIYALDFPSPEEPQPTDSYTGFMDIKSSITAIRPWVEIGQKALPIDNDEETNPPTTDLLAFKGGGFNGASNKYVSPIADADLETPYVLQAYDDGPISAGGHEPEGQVAEDGFFTASWTTPSYYAGRDFYMDVYAEDVSDNKMVWDNIRGFTTRPWTGGNRCLFVADYIAGQIFAQDRNINPNLGKTAIRVGWQPVESYWTTNPFMYENQTRYIKPAVDSLLYNLCPIFSFKDPTGQMQLPPGDPTLGSSGTTTFDIWRVQCRGPVPVAILQSYMPRTILQPGPTSVSGTHKVFVTDHYVAWACPYSGDLLTNNDSIDSAAVQANIATYLDGGGKLILSGQEIAWAVTRGGQIASPWLNTYLRVAYETDTSLDISRAYVANRHYVAASRLIGQGVAPQQWGDFTDAPLADPASFITGLNPVVGSMGARPTPIQGALLGSRTGAWNNGWIDSVTLTTGGRPSFGYFSIGEGSGVAGSYYEDVVKGSKVIYMAFGFEGICDRFVATTTPNLADPAIPPELYVKLVEWPRRSQFMLTWADWFLTGVFRGTVYSIDPQTGTRLPESGVLVQITQSSATDEYHFGEIVATGVTDSSGNYVIEGVPSAMYLDFNAVKPGFRIMHPERWEIFNGGDQEVMDLIITKEPPGLLKGKVVDKTQAPVVGAKVTANLLGLVADDPNCDTAEGSIDPDGTVIGLTDINGVYSLQLGTGKWRITVDATGQGFGPTTLPARLCANISSNITLNWTNDETQWFVVQPYPGGLNGTITSSEDGLPVKNASVTATFSTGTSTITKGPIVTGDDGTYDFGSELDAGNWIVVVTAPGFINKSSSASVTSNETTTLDITLVVAPPGVVRGYVLRRNDAVPISGLTVQALQSNVVIGETTTFTPSLIGSGHVYNFEFGTSFKLTGSTKIRVLVNGLGYDTPSDVTVVVPSGGTAYTTNIYLDPLKPISAGLTLFSTPFNYTDDPKTLMSGSSNYRLFTWITNIGRFKFYPNMPSTNDLLRGNGYYVQDTKSLAFITEGDAGNQALPFEITLQPGWNLIGDPFNFDVRWFTTPSQPNGARVKNPLNLSETLDMDTATARQLLASSLWSEIAGDRIPSYNLERWVGYWIRVYQPITVVIDPAGRLNSAVMAPVSAVRSVADQLGWRLQLVAEGAGMRDSGTYIGVLPEATLGFDNRFDAQKPGTVNSQYISMCIPHPEWRKFAGDFGIDIRSAKSVSQSWELKVDITVPNSSVSISWPGISGVGHGVALTLVDLKSGKRINMRNEANYTFYAKQAGTYRFRVLSVNAPSRGR